MTGLLYLATNHGIATYRKDGDRWIARQRGLDEEAVTSILLAGNSLLAGTRQGVFRLEDKRDDWENALRVLEGKYVRWLDNLSGQPQVILAGLEPAMIAVSRDGGLTWEECQEVGQLRTRHRWYLPYSPGAGCVRGFASHGDRVYAAVEVGGVLSSSDAGASWRLVRGSPGDPVASPSQLTGTVHPDVHSIYVHPDSPEMVCAATGGGLFYSSDGGRRWSLLYDCYCRAFWWDPKNPDHMLLGPANGVDTGGRIEESRDRGKSWLPASGGTGSPWQHHMVERFAAGEDFILAVLSNGQVLESTQERQEWKPVGAAGVRAVSIDRNAAD